MELKLDLQVMVIDLYAKNELITCRHVEKKVENCLIGEIY